jgi:hypothetical protein
VTSLSDESGSPLSDEERAHVARCLAAQGLITSPNVIAGVSSNGMAITFTDGHGLWVLPSTGRIIREGLRHAP